MKNLDYMQGQLDFLTELVDWYGEQVQLWKDTRPTHSKAQLRLTVAEELEDLLNSLNLRKYLLEQEIEEMKASATCIDDDRPTFDEDGN